MDATEQAAAPIYDQLIAERGDAVAVAARTAEQTRREAAEALDFSASGTGSSTPAADGNATADADGATAGTDADASGSSGE